ncbi:MAG: PQQ-binding-like beta-propeller repeat protein [Clostridia bacterium]|nr:PQQ-binding-like beta-propeller repeat protein [Clostridia bacterium]
MRSKKLSVVLLTFIYILVNILGITPTFAFAPRFGIDENNSRQIKDNFEETEFPFKEVWSQDLKGQVMSQPIVAGGYIYVQAGKDLVKLSLESGTEEGRIEGINDHELPSGSSPTYAKTTHAPRIYQATRDHQLWAIDVNTFKDIWHIFLTTDEDSDNYKKRYRVTSSPFVYIDNHRTYVAVGTANGDTTGQPVQYGDNGFFVIHDKGFKGKAIYNRQMKGEVTGSPIIHNGMIIGTENTQNQESQLIRYMLNKNMFIPEKCRVDLGVPSSPAAEGDNIYIADRTGCIYKFHNKSETEINKVWKNPEDPTDPDFTRPLNSYNLMSPAIGSKYIYLPLQHYNSKSYAGSGAVIAVDKETGLTHKVHQFESMLKSNILYWKPYHDQDQDYVFLFDYDGNAWVLDGETLEPVPWFYNATEKKRIPCAKLFPIEKGSVSPEIVVSDSYLLITDGEGIMHAYKAKNPVNFRAHKLEPVEKKEYKPGDTAILKFTVENTSEEKHDNIPVELITPEGLVIPGKNLFLAAGEKESFNLWEVTIPPKGNLYKATINPEGNQFEILEEVKPRLDNTAELILTNNRDLEVVSLEVPPTTVAKKVETIKATVVNNTENEQNDVLVRWEEDNNVIREDILSFAPKESKTISFVWEAPDRDDIVNIAVIVDPEQKIWDENYSNNFKEKYISVNKFVERSCENTLENASWDVTYRKIIGYHTHKSHGFWTDSEGNKHPTSHTVTDYDNPIWEPVTVTYNESLTAKVTINTKQGIPLDKDNKKELDRESRASWAIIPHAKELSKKLHKEVDPNEITRAGYGFEVKVETNYKNDWETKIPSGLEDTAHPIGGSYQGPVKVVAEFYNTRWKCVDIIELERTSGTSGEGTAIWELPIVKYRFPSGQKIYERKHYTSMETKDGNYHVIIRIENAGRNNLYTCLEKTVIIWGCAYDDIYTRPVPRYE